MPFLARASPKQQKIGMSIGFLSFKIAYNVSLMIVSHFLPPDIRVWVTWNQTSYNTSTRIIYLIQVSLFFVFAQLWYLNKQGTIRSEVPNLIISA